MSKFVVILSDRKNGELSAELLKKHVEYLKGLKKTDTLVICGPFKTSDSAIQIIEAQSIEKAEQIINTDPFISTKYYQSYRIEELIEANPSNNWLMEDTEEKIKKREAGLK